MDSVVATIIIISMAAVAMAGQIWGNAGLLAVGAAGVVASTVAVIVGAMAHRRRQK